MHPKAGYTLLFIVFFIPILLWNQPLFLFLNRLNSPIADYFFGIITGLADFLVALLFVFITMLFSLRLGLVAMLTYVIAGASNQFLKYVFDAPRPPALFEDIHILGEALTQHSFPSGHATSSGAFACLALLFWKKKPKLSWSIFVLFSLVAYGRVYGGVHFPIDIFIGFTMGFSIMWWMEKVSQKWDIKHWQHNQWSWKIPGLIVIVIATVIGTGYHIQPSTAQPLALVLPIAALMLVMQAWKKRLVREY